jgi:hypothetical protein
MLQHLKSVVATLKKHVATSQIDCCNTAKFKFMLSAMKHPRLTRRQGRKASKCSGEGRTRMREGGRGCEGGKQAVRE